MLLKLVQIVTRNNHTQLLIRVTVRMFVQVCVGFIIHELPGKTRVSLSVSEQRHVVASYMY